jgi:hypothetical protein
MIIQCSNPPARAEQWQMIVSPVSLVKSRGSLLVVQAEMRRLEMGRFRCCQLTDSFEVPGLRWRGNDA